MVEGMRNESGLVFFMDFEFECSSFLLGFDGDEKYGV
jgi:hypothetical protein